MLRMKVTSICCERIIGRLTDAVKGLFRPGTSQRSKGWESSNLILLTMENLSHMQEGCSSPQTRGGPQIYVLIFRNELRAQYY